MLQLITIIYHLKKIISNKYAVFGKKNKNKKNKLEGLLEDVESEMWVVWLSLRRHG